jgi:hypothetical protein
VDNPIAHSNSDTSISNLAMSLKETYTLAHTAKCKLYLAADRPDRNLRFLVGHAMHLDSLMLRIVEIEESIEKPAHSSGISFKGVSHGSHQPPQKSPLARRSPPPKSAEDEYDSDEEVEDDEAEIGEGELSLTRFPSGSARPPRDAPAPPLDPSDGEDSDSSDDEEYNWDPAFLRDLVKTDSDQNLKNLYHDVSSCPCHKGEGPKVERVWELPNQEGGKEGVRFAVAEIREEIRA